MTKIVITRLFSMLTGPRPGVSRLFSMSYRKKYKKSQKNDFELDFFTDIV